MEPSFSDSEEAPIDAEDVSTVFKITNECSYPVAHHERFSSTFVTLPDNEDKDPSRTMSLDEEHLPGVLANFAKRCDQTDSPNLGKRSATEACLADSPLPAGNGQPDQPGPYEDAICKPNTSDHGPDAQKKLAQSWNAPPYGSMQYIPTQFQQHYPLHMQPMVPTSAYNTGPIALGPDVSISQEPSGARAGRDAASNFESQRQHCSSRGASKPTLRLDTGVKMQQSSVSETSFVQNQDGNSNDFKTMITDSCCTQGATLTKESPINSGGMAINEHDTVKEFACLISPDLGQEDASNVTPPSPGYERGPATQLDIGMDDDDDSSTRPSSLPGMGQLTGSGPECFQASPLNNHDHIPVVADEHENCGIPTDEPTLDVFEDILLVQNTANVRTGIYKVVVTVTIRLNKATPDGWYKLVIPGLPKMRPGESGFFLFLIPEKYGVEYRTTNLRRYKMIEDCLFAEFIDKRNLEIPMRSFDQKNYGIVKDFTVDQEIKALPLLSSFSEEAEQSVRFYAMCSLRLHQRCFWAEKCCFYINLHGGPEGFYQCKLQPAAEDLQMIHIPTNGSMRTGVSHLQVICSPRDLEMFCITWLDKGRITTKNWLPQIYPTSSSCERSRNQLRNMFTKMFTNNFTERTSYRYKRPALNGGVGKPHVEALSSCDGSESPEQPLLSQDMISLIRVVMEVFRAAKTSLTALIATRTSRTQLLVLVLSVASTLCGVLGYFMRSHTCPRAFGRPSDAAKELNHCSLDMMRMNSRIPGCGEPGIECNVAVNLLKPIPKTNGDPSLFDSSDTSNHTARDEQKAYNSWESDMIVEEQALAEEQKTRAIKASGAGVSLTSDRGSSLRDAIDYWLGWKGPINRTA
jgi:hypothetical protein